MSQVGLAAMKPAELGCPFGTVMSSGSLATGASVWFSDWTGGYRRLVSSFQSGSQSASSISVRQNWRRPEAALARL